MARREYQAGRPTTLTVALNISGTSFTIANDTNWPDGADYDFWVTVDGGTAQEERILCSARTGTTVTVATSGRGKDGTTETNHAVGASVWPSWSATDADEANEHINATTNIHGITGALAPIASPTFTGTVVLPSATSIGNVSSTEIGYVDGVTSAIQTQLNTIVNTTIPAVIPVATIIMYGGTSAPTGWLLCNGQSTTGYTALAAIVGSTVPDLRGRAPIGYGAGTGLTARNTMAATVGAETHALTQSEMPRHNHGINPAAIVGTGTSGTAAYSPTGSNNQQAVTTFFTGGDGTDEASENALPHNNMQPSTVVNFIIKT